VLGDGVADPPLRVFEEGAVGGHAQARPGVRGVPFAHDRRRHDRRAGVVRVAALHAQVQYVVRVRRLVQLDPVQPAPAERLVAVRHRPVGEGPQVAGQQRRRRGEALREPDDIALHVGHAVRGVGEPDEDPVAGRRPPPERPAQVLPAGEERHRAAGPVVRRGEVPDTAGGERVDETDHRAGHVRVHRRRDRDAVPLPQVVGEPQHPVQLLHRAGLGVQLERHRGHLDAPGAGQRHEPVDGGGVPGVEPAPHRQRRLDGPPEARLVRPILGGGREVERGVQVLQVVAEHHALPVGVADVQVRVVYDVDRPLALRRDDELRLTDPLDRDGDGARRVHFGHPQVGAGGRPVDDRVAVLQRDRGAAGSARHPHRLPERLPREEREAGDPHVTRHGGGAGGAQGGTHVVVARRAEARPQQPTGQGGTP
jgi:hypothetical protein